MLAESGMESRAGVADEMSLAAWRREREVLVAERDAARAKAEASEGGGSGATTFVIAVTAATLRQWARGEISSRHARRKRPGFRGSRASQSTPGSSRSLSRSSGSGVGPAGRQTRRLGSSCSASHLRPGASGKTSNPQSEPICLARELLSLWRGGRL